MSKKCWFVLRHTHYPPPTGLEDGTGQIKGPVCCGHLIPDLAHLDNIINISGPLEIPADMPIYHTKSENMSWEQSSGPSINHYGHIGAPILAAAGITVTASAGIAFQKSVTNHGEFKRLDTYTIQATPSYIEDSITADEVSRYIQKNKRMGRWSLFMITGIAVARGARVLRSEDRKIGVQGGLGAGLYGLADAGAGIENSSEDKISMSGDTVSDFVWAVRLAKIRKGLLDKTWDYETHSKGATYSLDSGDRLAEMKEILHNEGIADERIIAPGDDSEIFVV
ncbi:hypothetical protein CSAL01_13264 [Colletotrichum salicis]|uniref:Uncharacterized protein n=1 Tax=Colletotrichum salicis TaxID=1209931 RepID=A0A135V3U2_9PEZI|nr:hypothetical protein CSAL01_13264 [Colletotrichum salicis]